MKDQVKDWPGKAMPRIVCAAILCSPDEDEILIVGPRHGDSTMRRQLDMLSSQQSAHSKGGTQGFIDQFGDFYDRQEAWKVAEAAGQIWRRCVGDTAKGGTLYSENLY